MEEALARRLLLVLLGTLWLSGCEGATVPPREEEGPVALLQLGPAELQMEAPPAGSVPVGVGVFLTVPDARRASSIRGAAAAQRVRRVLQEANLLLAQCGLHAAPEVAQVVGVPVRLLQVQGNLRGSWGGHPPAAVGDPDLFMYQQGERLTADTRELFGHGKRHTSPNAISVFVVHEIEYYIGEQRSGAGGLSFPPVIYHHADDYPLRNSVLVKQVALDEHDLPVASGQTLAHELGHMLLNTGDHVGPPGNLMVGGPTLTPSQCERMHRTRERIFGQATVIDPGPPTGT
jgi:hypothetical protein